MDEIVKIFLEKPSQMIFDFEIKEDQRLLKQVFSNDSSIAAEYFSFKDFESVYFVSDDDEKVLILRSMFKKANNVFGYYQNIVEKMPNRLPSDIYEKCVDLMVNLAQSTEEIKWIKQNCRISKQQWEYLIEKEKRL